MDDKNLTDKLIYIADDDLSIRMAVKTFMDSVGYTVRDFENGDDLLVAFNNKPADFVILDVMMPGTHNGFSVLRELRAISNVPVIMLTARDSDQDYRTGLDLGSDDFLVKPVNPMNIVMRVKSIFRRIAFDRADFEKEMANKS